MNPQTTEHKVFIGFLFFMIVCLIALSFTVIFDAGAEKRNYSRDISESDLVALSSMELLNSLYRDGSTLQPGCESTLLLIRHCDKDTDADGVVHRGGSNYCSWLGRERSFFFASLFDDSLANNPNRRYPAPSQIIALTEERDSRFEPDSNGKKNYREIETVMPLANKFGLDIDVYGFNNQVIASDIFESLQSGEMCGKMAVVSWKHELLPDLALNLGCGPAEGCPRQYPIDTFDEMWQLKYVFDPRGIASSTLDPMDLDVNINQHQGIDYPINRLDDNNEDEDRTEDTGVDSNSTVSEQDSQHRRLKYKYHHAKKAKKSKAESKHPRKNPSKYQKWSVYGTKVFQRFDPLQYSTSVGDYPPQGSPRGGKWADEL